MPRLLSALPSQPSAGPRWSSQANTSGPVAARCQGSRRSSVPTRWRRLHLGFAVAHQVRDDTEEVSSTLPVSGVVGRGDYVSGPVNSSDLEIFVGQWTVEVRFPGGPAGGSPPAGGGAGPVARSVFEWILGGRYLTQRTEISIPDAPDSLAIVAFDPQEGRYTQHYYDSRGVTRLYAMTLADGAWTLLRESADFSPLDFAQRFTGTFSADGNRIDGAWELAQPGSGWELDFEMSYSRIT
jgi:uncharacterized protein DUF1579